MVNESSSTLTSPGTINLLFQKNLLYTCKNKTNWQGEHCAKVHARLAHQQLMLLVRTWHAWVWRLLGGARVWIIGCGRHPRQRSVGCRLERNSTASNMACAERLRRTGGALLPLVPPTREIRGGMRGWRSGSGGVVVRQLSRSLWWWTILILSDRKSEVPPVRRRRR